MLFCPETVSQLVCESDDGLVERASLLVVEERDEARVLPRAAGSSRLRQTSRVIVEIPE